MMYLMLSLLTRLCSTHMRQSHSPLYSTSLLHLAARLGHEPSKGRLIGRDAPRDHPAALDSSSAAVRAARDRLDAEHAVKIRVPKRKKLDDGSTVELSPAELYEAAMHGSAQLLRYLMDLGLDPGLNMLDYAGAGPLHEAAMEGNTAAIDVMIQRGVPVDVPDDTHSTPLFYAG